ncbi:Fusaric acid resistance protein-like-domain-containing protein [Mucor lusitanicus]|uniref:Fusaric acid resistance protein-like-domain-containing protein n=1 Tax=Mucor circinelloides f. lusitanicus TaxID=29924 RepID=A0A8H4BNV1_MUCCL|nr:Fusaric acid resistance protein-like-domain-containing protein [Mucor lusitanicus]
MGSIPTASPSAYSAFDVVLDDGTLQKRTISLSTLPDDLDEEEDSQETLDNDKTPLLLQHKNKSYASIQQEMPFDVDSSTTTSNEDSDSTDTSDSKQKRYKQLTQPGASSTATKRRWLAVPQLTANQRLVLKCSFAYMLGSLFTFVPAMNALIGYNHVSSHLVATATVFFNPAKSLGGMVEAALYGWGYTLFALMVCLGSMITTDFFVDRNMFHVAHAISLGFWLAGSTFIVAFLKAHWNKPPVATASSLCFIIIFIIVVREGSANRGDFDTTRIEQITSAVATGTLVTVSCCILFWPVSASKKLKQDFEATLMSYKVLLKLLTKTFLLDDDLPEFKANNSLKTAIDSHRASFTSLQKSLAEAKLEVIWNDEIRGCTREYDAVVKSMQRLAQSVGGLRSSCGLQFELMQQDGAKNAKKPASSSSSAVASSRTTTAQHKKGKETWNIKADHHRRKLEGQIKRQKQQQQKQRSTTTTAEDEFFQLPNHQGDPDDDGTLIEFIHTIRQPLKSLAYTCKQTILHLQIGFSSKPRTGPSDETLKSNLIKAIALFEVSQRQAVKRLNKHRLKHHPTSSSSTSWADSYAPSEDVFLVYFFVFNMIEFARELISLVESVQALSIAKQKKRTLCSLIYQFFTKTTTTTAAEEKKKPAATFIPNERHKMDTLHTPIPKTHWRRMILHVWRTFSLLKLQKTRYAIKATVAVILLAIPAFLESTGTWFREWRMEWALITLMVVMTPVLGGTNLVAIYRIYSTALGCFVAMCFYLLFPDNMYMLILCTWLFSIPNFYLILHHKHGKFGQFTLLAYNLVMLNKYNDRETHRIEVTHLALQRCLSILVGVVFGLFATAYVWPYEARVELRKGVSDFLLRLAWLYKRLVSVYSQRPSPPPAESITSSSVISFESLDNVRAQRQHTSQVFMDVELGLQRTLLELQELLKQTPNEPRLKGAFPVATYSDILASLQNITDKFASMRTVVLKDAWYEQVQHDFINPVSQERKEMVGNVLLYFYILASAMRLKTPLPPYLPPARKAWESLITRLRQLPVVQSKQLLEKDHVYLFYYAYVTVLEDIIRDLDKASTITSVCLSFDEVNFYLQYFFFDIQQLGANMTLLFGAIVPGDQWETLFDASTGDIEQNSATSLLY